MVGGEGQGGDGSRDRSGVGSVGVDLDSFSWVLIVCCRIPAALALRRDIIVGSVCQRYRRHQLWTRLSAVCSTLSSCSQRVKSFSACNIMLGSLR